MSIVFKGISFSIRLDHVGCSFDERYVIFVAKNAALWDAIGLACAYGATKTRVWKPNKMWTIDGWERVEFRI